MFKKTFASAVIGVDARTITIEVNAGGIVAPNKKLYYVVGLPDNAVREGFERIDAAIQNTGKRILRVKTIVNLAPADIKKEGSAFDLPIALGILTATKQINPENIEEYILMGELSLDGKLRPIKGALPIAIQAIKEGFKSIILPRQNAKEAAIVKDLQVYGVSTLEEAIEILENPSSHQPVILDTRKQFVKDQSKPETDFSDVKGQLKIKRALEIAAAGGHNVLLIGPPGAGKTMLARRLPTILPSLSLKEALETTKIHSVAGRLPENSALVSERPFRSPHHTISDVALVGGGSHPMPGEISLAHNGVLFLDELPEFKRTVLEVLRQPMEERKVTISRARISIDFPSNFILIASMNPCLCGFFNHPTRDCHCSPAQVQRYLNKISGPLLDRIDLHVEVTPVSFDELTTHSNNPEETSQIISQRVAEARNIQSDRFTDWSSIHTNAQMPSRMVREVCALKKESSSMLKMAMEKLQLSARAYDRILKVARTIADLDNCSQIQSGHIAEAIQFRSLDREDWAS